MAVAEGIAALNSIKSLYEIIKEVRDSNDPDRLKVAAAQMFDLALAAREQTAALHERCLAIQEEYGALKGKVEKLEAFDTKIENYVRKPTMFGGAIYIEKGTPEHEAQSPKFCPDCFENRRLSIFQPSGVMRMFKCIGCGAQQKM